QVRGAADGGVTVGQRDPEVLLEPLDRLGHLIAVVAPQLHVERVSGLVVRQQIAAGVGHGLIFADGRSPVSVSAGTEWLLGRIDDTARKRLMAVRCWSRLAGLRTPRPSSGARVRTPTLPW